MGQEGLEYDSTSGALSTFDTWEYKPPQSLDIPIKWATTLLKDVKNPTGFHGTYVHFLKIIFFLFARLYHVACLRLVSKRRFCPDRIKSSRCATT